MDEKKRVVFLVSAKLHRQIRLLAAAHGVSVKKLILYALEGTYKEMEVICEKQV